MRTLPVYSRLVLGRHEWLKRDALGKIALANLTWDTWETCLYVVRVSVRVSKGEPE